ncbi:MAG: single-stranded DNA-binding protein [Bacteroidetes bacterium]|nr:single-stranded DNA-binding protein [Bacteroidota bacterium]
MSGTLNKVMLIGRLGDEVKMHYFDDANCVGRFPLATDESYTNKEGDRITNTDWHNIVVRNKAAEICSKYLTKGDLIYVEGRLKNRQWKGEDGQTRYSTEIHVNDFTFLSNKKEDNKTAETPKPKIDNQTAPATPSNTNLPSAEQEDDLPF